VLKETAVAAVLSLGAAATIFASGGPGLDPAPGRFLVAERQLRDPNFNETVVLLTEYGENGAMGVIVNWPTAAPTSELLPEVEGLADWQETIYVGGPVSRQVMFMLVRSAAELPQAQRVFADVHLSSSRELLQQVVSGEIEATAMRLYSGYAGWSAGQLDMELALGSWRILPGDAALVFEEDPDSIWPELMRRGEMQWTRRPAPAAVATAP
jgi:putative transcriptional regulator